jgi:hypothetical protein
VLAHLDSADERNRVVGEDVVESALELKEVAGRLEEGRVALVESLVGLLFVGRGVGAHCQRE